MIRLLEVKKKELVDFIDMEKTSKIKSIKEQVSSMSTKIQKTTGLLQYCVETLKEQDPSSFLQVNQFNLLFSFFFKLHFNDFLFLIQISEHMINRMCDIESKFPQDTDLQPKVELDFDFMLNSEGIYKEIKKLNYKQLKGEYFYKLSFNQPSEKLALFNLI